MICNTRESAEQTVHYCDSSAGPAAVTPDTLEPQTHNTQTKEATVAIMSYIVNDND